MDFKKTIKELKTPIKDYLSNQFYEREIPVENEHPIKNPNKEAGIHITDNGAVHIFSGDSCLVLDNGEVYLKGVQTVVESSIDFVYNDSDGFSLNGVHLTEEMTSLNSPSFVTPTDNREALRNYNVVLVGHEGLITSLTQLFSIPLDKIMVTKKITEPSIKEELNED